MRNVAVVFGGPSREHDVSVLSGRQVLAGLDPLLYRALPVLIEREGRWIVDGLRCDDALAGARALRERGCDIVFPALHGPFGEDGTFQAFLQTAGLPYVGSGVAASALAADKTRCKRFLEAFGVPGAPDVTVPPATAREVLALGFPVVVKNPHEGSTLGLRLAADETAYDLALAELAPTCPELLVEKRIAGRELTAPVLENDKGEPKCLPLVEIEARDGFFDYDEKYSENGARKICPAPVGESVAADLAACALLVHRTLGLRGLSRSDFILREDGTFVFLEVNTIPGLTPGSLLPHAARHAGLEFPALLTHLVETALGDAPLAARPRPTAASPAQPTL